MDAMTYIETLKHLCKKHSYSVETLSPVSFHVIEPGSKRILGTYQVMKDETIKAISFVSGAFVVFHKSSNYEDVTLYFSFENGFYGVGFRIKETKMSPFFVEINQDGTESRNLFYTKPSSDALKDATDQLIDEVRDMVKQMPKYRLFIQTGLLKEKTRFE